MEWEHQHKDWGDGYTDDHWFCGVYKITFYQPIIGTVKHDRPGFFAAYVKPAGWKNWGNHVNAAVPYYSTLEAAQAACAAHAGKVVL